MDFALTLADRTDAAVTALHVIETIDTRPELSGAMADLQKRRCDTERRYLEEIDAARAGGNRIANVVTLGRPYLEILRIAEERAADLIVIGCARARVVRHPVVWLDHQSGGASRHMPGRHHPLGIAG